MTILALVQKVEAKISPQIVDRCGCPNRCLHNHMAQRAGVLLCLFMSTHFVCAEDNFFAKWEARTAQTQAKQPAWAPPLVTTFVGLIQVARADFARQISPTLATTWNYDTSKGLNLVPWADTEIDVNLPPYFEHSVPSAKDGAGDMSFLLKYRFLTGNEAHGNYALIACVIATIPTGSHKNGSSDATVAPTFGAAKGFGRFNVQSTLGATLPTGSTTKLGRPILWNAAGQYHLGKYLWPELEFNSTYFHGGPNDAKTQSFVTPGFTVGRIKVRSSEENSRLGIGIGGGMQIATSRFHSNNHGLIFTGRLLF